MAKESPALIQQITTLTQYHQKGNGTSSFAHKRFNIIISTWEFLLYCRNADPHGTNSEVLGPAKSH